jgi:hypothetical protein
MRFLGVGEYWLQQALDFEQKEPILGIQSKC